MISLLAGSFVAIVVLILYLIKWNRTLEQEVKIKSQELFEAERIRKILDESSEGIKRYLNQVKEAIKQEKIRRGRSNDI